MNDIHILENKRRGLGFGKSFALMDRVRYLVKEYHGYYFSWAIVYTFWFHPIEINVGHLLGTFYAILIIVQGSLIFTRYHTNKYWKVLLETFVLIHGAIVAYISIYHDIWPMFAFGFLTLFFTTQIYGLGWSKKWITMATGLFIIAMLVFYRDDYMQMLEITRIPFILIVVAIVLTLLLYPIYKYQKKAK